MQLKLPGVSFEEDSRGVSGVVGFIMIFAILMILLSINQAQFVPQENREIEFQHFQEVRNDMVEVRSSISTAGQANVSQYPTVKLGTNYPVRLFAVNPPPPSGSLETSEPYDIQINDLDGGSETVSSRFLVYRNGYNEMDIGPIWYEHSVLYLDARDNGGDIAIYEDQNIITGNNSARVTALQNEFSVTSTGEMTVELYPTETTSVNLDEMEGNITLKIPTRLNESVYWNDAIGDLNSNGEWEYHGTEPHPEEGIWWLNLTVDADSLKFNTVGIDSPPSGQGSASQGVGPGGGGGEIGNQYGCDNVPPMSDPDVKYFTEDENGGIKNIEAQEVVIDGVSVSGGITGEFDLFLLSGSDVSGGIDVEGFNIYHEIDLNNRVSGGITGNTIDCRGTTTTTTTTTTVNGDSPNVEIVQQQINNGDIVLQFRNNNQESVTFSRVRLNSYDDDNPPSNPNRGPIDRVIYNFDGTETVLDEGDPLEGVPGPTISNGGNQDLTFDPKVPQNGQYKDEAAETGDTMIITVEFGDGTTREYTVTL